MCIPRCTMAPVGKIAANGMNIWGESLRSDWRGAAHRGHAAAIDGWGPATGLPDFRAVSGHEAEGPNPLLNIGALKRLRPIILVNTDAIVLIVTVGDVIGHILPDEDCDGNVDRNTDTCRALGALRRNFAFSLGELREVDGDYHPARLQEVTVEVAHSATALNEHARAKQDTVLLDFCDGLAIGRETFKIIGIHEPAPKTGLTMVLSSSPVIASFAASMRSSSTMGAMIWRMARAAPGSFERAMVGPN